MSDHDDHDDHDRLLRSLRAPGSPAELAQEGRYRAMFRAQSGSTTPTAARARRASRRLLAGGALAAVVAVGTGGVAAAYAGHLPSPIQTLAHHVIGAPEASAAVPTPRRPTRVVSTPSPSAGPSAVASPAPPGRPVQRRPHQPRRRPPHARPHLVPAPAGSAAPVAPSVVAASEPPIPTSSASAPPPAALVGVLVVGVTHRADVGAQVSFSGQLVHSGTSTARSRVVLQQRVGSRWTPVARGRADAAGSIALTAPPLQRTSSFRLLAGRSPGAVHSTPWRVAMRPLLTASSSSTRTTATIEVSALGGAEGDSVLLATRHDGGLHILGQTRLDAFGSASFDVTPDQRRTSYAIVLAPTRQHTSARTGVVVRLASARP